MTLTLIYILKVNLLLSIVYLFYYLFLRKETFVKNNRQYFLIGILTSFLLPLITYTKVVEVKRELIDLSALLTANESEAQIVETSSFWMRLSIETQLIVIGVIITLLFLGRLITKSYRLWRHISQLKRSSLGSNILIDTQTTEAYSFWKWVILPGNYSEIERIDVIIEHEQIHVKQKHSVDILLIEVVKTVFWFNPVLILLQKDINLNLEYIVDQEVSKRVDIYDYQMALVQFEYDKIKPMPLVNSFSTSDLKKRVLMLNTQKSTIMKKLKFVMITPVVAGFFFLFQVNVKAKTLENVSLQAMESIFEESASEELSDSIEDYVTEEGRKDKTSKEVALSEAPEKREQEKGNATVLEIEAIKKDADHAGEEAERLHRKLKEIREERRNELAEKREVASQKMEERRNQVIQRQKEITAETKARNENLERESAKRRAQNEEVLKKVDSKKKNRKAKLSEQELENTLFVFDGKKMTKEEFYALDLNPTEIKTLSFYKKEDAAAKFGTPTDTKVLEISSVTSTSETKKVGGLTKYTVVTSKEQKNTFEGITLVDGKKISREEMQEIDTERIESVSVLKGEQAIAKYGELGAKGVIEIVLKK